MELVGSRKNFGELGGTSITLGELRRNLADLGGTRWILELGVAQGSLGELATIAWLGVTQSCLRDPRARFARPSCKVCERSLRDPRAKFARPSCKILRDPRAKFARPSCKFFFLMFSSLRDPHVKFAEPSCKDLCEVCATLRKQDSEGTCGSMLNTTGDSGRAALPENMANVGHDCHPSIAEL